MKVRQASIKTVAVCRSLRASERVPRREQHQPCPQRGASSTDTHRRRAKQSSSMTSGNILTFCLWICLLYCCYTVTQGELAVDCCLSVSHKQIPPPIVRSYMRQNKGNGCDLSAIIFFTRKGIRLCAPPEAPWVKNLMSRLDTVVKKCKSGKMQGRSCRLLKSDKLVNSAP